MTALRPADPADVPLLLSFMQAFYAESGYPLERGPAEAALADLVASEARGRIWLIEDAGRPVGYVALTFGFSLEYFGRDAFIDDLFLEPSARGRGIGARALEEVEREARAAGVLAVHLEVERSNAPAQSLYRKRGFRDNDRQLLSKRLSSA